MAPPEVAVPNGNHQPLSIWALILTSVLDDEFGWKGSLEAQGGLDMLHGNNAGLMKSRHVAAMHMMLNALKTGGSWNRRPEGLTRQNDSRLGN